MYFVNNSVTSMGGGYAAYINGGFAINTSDHNNYYTASGALFYFGSSQYNTLAGPYKPLQDRICTQLLPTQSWEDLSYLRYL